MDYLSIRISFFKKESFLYSSIQIWKFKVLWCIFMAFLPFFFFFAFFAVRLSLEKWRKFNLQWIKTKFLWILLLILIAICQELYLLWKTPLSYKPTDQQYVNVLVHLTFWKSRVLHCTIQDLKQLRRILKENLF